MSLKGRSILSIDDLSDSEIERILEVAEGFDSPEAPKMLRPRRTRRKLFAAFYEPSSRTYFSFREAMRELGGDWDGVLNAATDTSVAKGESLADSIRTFETVSGADVLVLRHPHDGAARVADEFAFSVPIINAGDGAHEHPTQTLIDLYTIRKEKGSIRNVVVALWGDLLHARTAHSLAVALARLGAKVRAVSPEGLGLPEHVRSRVEYEQSDFAEYTSESDAVAGEPGVIYRTETGQTRPAFALSEFGVMYVTRLQVERFDEGSAPNGRGVGTLTGEMLRMAPDDTIILHPLPRKGEISYELDTDKRAAYFRQMENSIPVRKSILSLILGWVDSKGTQRRRTSPSRASVDPGARCVNGRCVTNHEDYVAPRFVTDSWSENIRCDYCGFALTGPNPADDPSGGAAGGSMTSTGSG